MNTQVEIGSPKEGRSVLDDSTTVDSSQYPRRAILITGHAGTIGPAVVEKFLKQGFCVIGCDMEVPEPSQVAEHKLKDLMGTYGRFCDVRELPAQHIGLEELKMCGVSSSWFDDIRYILHMGCPASPKNYQAHPNFTIESNVEGTKNLLEVARMLDARFVFTSTSEVYGTLEKDTFSEEDSGKINPYGTRSCYDVSKMLGETLCREALNKNVNAGVVRLFNTYSEYGRPDDGRVVNAFVYNLLMGKPVQIYGTGKQTRSFQYVSDLADGLFRYVTADSLFEPVNLGNPNEYCSITHLARTIYQMVHGKPWSHLMRQYSLDNVENHCLMDKDDPPVRRPDISKAKDLLGWEPKVTLEDGLQRIIKAYKHNYMN